MAKAKKILLTLIALNIMVQSASIAYANETEMTSQSLNLESLAILNEEEVTELADVRPVIEMEQATLGVTPVASENIEVTPVLEDNGSLTLDWSS